MRANRALLPSIVVIAAGATVVMTACGGDDANAVGPPTDASSPPEDAEAPDATMEIDASGPTEAAAEACVPPAPIVEAQWTPWPSRGDGGAAADGASMAPAQGPPARGYHAMAWGWNEDAGVALLFGGGNVNAGLRGDTWTFDSTASAWTSLGSKAGPAARGGHSIVFAGKSQPTPTQGDFVLFGGQGQDFFGDTWTFDASAGWTSVCNTDTQTCGCGPCPRAYQAMAFDAVRNEVVLFGGRDMSGPSNETWVFTSDKRWTAACSGPCMAPSARSEHAMAFDPARGVIVLFGGKAADGMLLGDTWEWNGSAWTEDKPSSSPSPRSGHVMATDAVGIFLFGGDGANGAAADSLWRWDGTIWSSVDAGPPSPSPRAYSALASDAVASRLLLFGGGDTGELGDTWRLGVTEVLPDAGCPTTPDATTGKDAGTTGACAKLTSCCAMITNALEQGTCLSAVGSASASTCGAALAVLEDGGVCP